jgi:hypothetical protein
MSLIWKKCWQDGRNRAIALPCSTFRAKKLPRLILTTSVQGIVVRKQDLRKSTFDAAEQSNNKKLNKRLSKFDAKNRKRMATGAKVYQIEKFVRTPEAVSGEFASETKKTYPKTTS